MRPAENAQLALLLEVSGTPKPGNVDRDRDLDDLRYEQFLAGAVGAGAGLRAAESDPIGPAFERAVEGMADRHGENTQFGALLLLTPLVRAASEGELSPAGVDRVVRETTVADAAAFYRAFEHCSVFVSDPPAEWDDLDVRRGSAAIPAVEERGLTLHDVMALGDSEDDVAREWTGGFERSFRVADRIEELPGPLSDRAAAAFCEQLAERRDTLVAKKHGNDVAEWARQEIADHLGDVEMLDALATAFVERGVNPGTTADIVAAGLFIALERGGRRVSGEGDGSDEGSESRGSDWPVELGGVTESIVATLGPNDRWNFAALGLFAGEPVTARTWGNTRTRRNFHRQGEGYVQFTRDPVDFVEAACSIHERDGPVLPSADAWARVEVERIDGGESDGTRWEEWELFPVESAVETRVVPTTSRGYGAVIEATVAASRLDVGSYDTDELLERLAYFERVVERCGDEREREAFERLAEHAGLDRRNESF